MIEIVMAVYEPNEEWLRKQLLSLNAQSAQGLTLSVRDDHSENFPFERLQALVSECITRFPARVRRNERNLGSSATFGLMTLEATGDYIAYCDQDDIWEEDKLQRLLDAFSDKSVTLSLCDLCVIDENDTLTAKRVTDVKPHIVYRSGGGLAPCFLTSNFVTGCASLVRAQVAKDAQPFPESMVHDQWLGLFAATRGRLRFVDEPLVRYRIHSQNQTPTLGRIRTKQDYIRLRVDRFQRWMDELQNRVDLGKPQRDAENWAAARTALSKGEINAWFRLLSLLRVNKKITLFELLLPLMPKNVFQAILTRIQRGAL